MKKIKAILVIMGLILLALALTVPSQKDYETYILEKVKEETHDDLFGLNDFLITNVSNVIFKTADYTDVKLGSTYTFNLGENKDYKFVGFGTLIICIEGDLSMFSEKK